jgi:outer membrane protein assembly factor BamB
MLSTRRAFLSHAFTNNDLCEPIVRALIAQEVDIWYDRASVDADPVLPENLLRELQRCSAFLFFATPEAVASARVMAECNTFLGMKTHDPDRIFLTVIVSPVALPGSIAAFQVIDATQMPLEGTLNAILTALQFDPALRSAPNLFPTFPVSQPPVGNISAPPYLYMSPYDQPLKPPPTPLAAKPRSRRGFIPLLAVVALILLSAIGLGIFAFIQHTAHQSSTSRNASGTLVWRYGMANKIDASPAYANGMLYVGSSDGTLYALNATNGAVLWRYKATAAIHTTPVAANGVVYFGADDDHVYALQAVTGKFLWSFATRSSVESSPTVANDLVYFGAQDHYIYAVDVIGGKLRWKYFTGNRVNATPTVANGMVYVGSEDQYEYALNAMTGVVTWKFQAGKVATRAFVNANSVYFGAENGNVYALNATTGAALWSYTTTGAIYSSPTVDNGIVYIGSNDQFLYALKAADGTFLWHYQTGSVISSSPAVVNHIAYFGSGDHYIYAVLNGFLVWRYKAGNAVYSSPVIAGNILYCGSSDGTVYAIHI